MKKRVMVSLVLVLGCFLLFFSKSEAEDKYYESDLIVEVEGVKDSEIPVTKPPLIDGGNNKPPLRLLPQTGELLTSMIIILIGISLFIFSFGVIAIKQLYKNLSWEV